MFHVLSYGFMDFIIVGPRLVTAADWSSDARGGFGELSKLKLAARLHFMSKQQVPTGP